MIKFIATMKTRRLKSLRESQSGFTLLELLIATTIFSVILLLCTFGLIEIGNMYYKGVNSVKTQSASRTAVESLSQSIQFGGQPPDVTVGSADTAGEICIGDVHYAYKKDSPVKADVAGSYAFVRSKNCVTQEGKQELLGENMRLTKFTLLQKNGGYQIDMKVTTGDTDLIDPATGDCKGGFGRRFCASSGLSTLVQRKLR